MIIRLFLLLISQLFSFDHHTNTIMEYLFGSLNNHSEHVLKNISPSALWYLGATDRRGWIRNISRIKIIWIFYNNQVRDRHAKLRLIINGKERCLKVHSRIDFHFLVYMLLSLSVISVILQKIKKKSNGTRNIIT